MKILLFLFFKSLILINFVVITIYSDELNHFIFKGIVLSFAGVHSNCTFTYAYTEVLSNSFILQKHS